MSLAELVVYCGLLHIFYEPIRKFADENGNVQKGVVAAERLFEVLNIESDIQDSPHAIEFNSFEKMIEFDRVWFRYGDEWVLRDVSFQVKKGESVAIVGATGSGKSTILQLIPRLYNIHEGSIKIDGRPLMDYTQESLRRQIAYVSQKPFLFCDSVRENIAYGQDLSMESIQRAAKKAHADEFIEDLKEKYDTVLAELGKNLSGGQQQRLAIARALAKEAPILILDEATSSLDSISENKIKEAIESLHGEITQIIVAHRLSTIEHVDKIIFIEHGIKIGEGAKEELYQTCPAFRLMWDAHFRQRVLEPVRGL
jgi:ABC-type multidrug transport system fused ATPase/permease subunit